MKVVEKLWRKKSNWSLGSNDLNPNFILYFGNRNLLTDADLVKNLKETYPNAQVVGCSTGGEIFQGDVYDDSIAALLIEFESTTIKISQHPVHKNSFEVGQALANDLQGEDLAGVFILSEGLDINGSELVKGLVSIIGDKVSITGGLAGDGADFKKTVVGYNDDPISHQVVGVGFYGKKCKIGHGSQGGWNTFGPERIITKSEGNIVFELDNKPALALYKHYLGEEADNLPGSGLLFPLCIRSSSDDNNQIVRTILSVDENDQSLTFAGDMPQGNLAQLMKGNFNGLVEGAEDAAKKAFITKEKDHVAILISCIGRKLLMGQRVGDEVEAVQSILGPNSKQIGFYSYGEICPHDETGLCNLHNQTMTITTIFEE